jgi:uncharacterized membrane protein
MAGIGFTLRRMLQEGGFAGPLKALSYAMVISAGPWLASSATLAILGAQSSLPEGSHDHKVFLAIVSYIFAFSLIAVGAVHMVASRYLADRLYEDRWEAFAPAFSRLAAPLLGAQALIAAGFLYFVPLGFFEKLAALIGYLAVTGTWLSMVFLSAAKDYRAIVSAFVGGFALSVIGGILGSRFYGLAGQLIGFTSGFWLVFLILLGRVRHEFGLPQAEAEGLGDYFKRFWPLAVTGLAYNVGIWIDKILFWFHPEAGEQVCGPLHVAPVYDNAMFMAYLTIIPAMGMFLLRVETDFYDAYRGYFAAIAAHARLADLARLKAEMATTLWRNLILVLKVQAPLTIGAILFAPEVMGGLKLQWLSIFVFRFGALGSILHVLHLMVLILLLYLEFRMEAMAVALTFALSNTLLTLLSFAGGPGVYGVGYAASCALTLFAGLALLARSFEKLEYHVFMRQPLT